MYFILCAMRCIGLSCLGLVALLAWTGSAGFPAQGSVIHAVCRPSSNCKEIARTADGYMYEVNGHKIIMNYQDNTLFNLWCNHAETDAIVSADDPDLPAMARPVTVEKAVFNGCKIPHGTYFDALKALNVTVSKALLLQLHAEAKLQKDHLRGLQILSDLEITAVEREKPPRPAFDYLNALPGLVTLKLTDVIPEPEALMQLPTSLETLNFVRLTLPVAEKALRNGSNVTPPWLQRLHSLRSLHIVEFSSHSAAHPRSVTPPQLASLPNLTSVTLYHIPLDTNGLSSWLKDSAVRNLTLLACGLTDLPENIFENTNLTKINLTYNNLTSLPDYVFSPLQLSLRELDLSYNTLSGVALQRTVQSLKHLETLKANKNPLGSLCSSGTFTRSAKASTYLPKSLRRLELSSTQATRICSDWIENSALMHIELSNNEIDYLVYSDLAMKRKFRETSSPVRLNLKYNPLQYIDVSRSDVKNCVTDASLTSDEPNNDDMVRAPVKLGLTTLACDCDTYWLYEALRQCNLLQLDDDVACSSAGLHKSLLAYKPDEFLCAYNEPCVPETDCTCSKRPYDNATVVRCTGTLPQKPKWPPSEPGWPLALYVAPGTLTAMPAATLVELHAPKNNITRIGDNDISNTLRVLDVRNNSISHVSFAAAQMLSRTVVGKNHSVHFAGNRLACECSDVPTFGLLKQVVHDWNITQCIDQSYVFGKTKGDLCVNLLLPIMFGVAVPLLILVVAVMLLQRMLPRIKQFLFGHNMCLGWILSVDDNINDSDKTHDVFLSYSYEDLEQLNILKKGLEELGYSVIEHCQDWQPGDAVMEQIARSVLCARRTLLLVSDNYAKSQWALEEFHAAHAHAMERRSARVLIVRCGLQKPEVLPKDLKLYLMNHTYLAWEDPKFWYKLCHNMPPLAQEHKSVMFAAHDMPPPLYYKHDANKNIPLLQVPLISTETVPGAC